MQKSRRHRLCLVALLLLAACDRSQDQPRSTLPLALNELMAKPASGEDWIEILNLSDQPVDLKDVTLTDGNDPWPFPDGTRLEGGAYLLVLADGTGEEGKASFKLSASGESLSLLDDRNLVIDEVTFGEQTEEVSWGRLPNGTGDWRALAVPTPGAPNVDTPTPTDCLTDPAALQGTLVLNELLSNGSSDPDWIELLNTGTQCIDLAGLTLTDDPAQPTQFTFPPGTELDAGQYLLVYADDVTADDGTLHAPFKLSSGGEQLQLAGPEGDVVVDAVTFPALDLDQSYGRLPDGTGEFQVLTTPTPGATNQ